MAQEPFITIEQAATLCGLHPGNLRRYAASAKLQTVQVGNAKNAPRLTTRTWLQAFLDSRASGRGRPPKETPSVIECMTTHGTVRITPTLFVNGVPAINWERPSDLRTRPITLAARRLMAALRQEACRRGFRRTPEATPEELEDDERYANPLLDEAAAGNTEAFEALANLALLPGFVKR